MEKLIKCALATKFNQTSIDAIMEVIHSTPNAAVATEILLGLYEEPTFADTHTVSNTVRRFISYNKWSDQISYSYEKNQQVHIYIDKNVDEKLVTKDNYKDYIVKYNPDNIKSKWITLDEIVEATSYCSASEWPQICISGPCMEEELLAC